MATSDWIFSSNNSATNTAIAYAPAGSVPAPPGGGSYARSLGNGANVLAYSGFYPSSATLSNVPYSPTPRAIRVQCMHYAPTYNGSGFSLAVKCAPSSADLNGQVSGYSLNVYGASGVVTLRRKNIDAVILQASNPAGAWYSWRLSVYPITATQDRVIAERETSPGSGVWTSTWSGGSGDIVATGSDFVAWGGSNSRNGVWNVTQGVNWRVFVDLLQVSLANTPVPIP